MSTILTFSEAGGNNLLPGQQWDCAILSTVLDPRGQAASDWVHSRAKKIESLNYDAAKTALMSGNNVVSPQQVRSIVHNSKKLLLEATTMGVVEILLVLKAAYLEKVDQIDLLYVEPIDYHRDTNPIQWGRDFSLSGSRRFAGVKGFSHDLSSSDPGQLIAFLGYEGARLRQALEQLEMKDWSFNAVFGVPGFEPGWEINALANNISVLEERGDWTVKYCAAASVSAAYRLLSTITRTDQVAGRPTLLLPLGTKPHSIACSIFLCENSGFQMSGITFDHPKRSAGRSDDVREWHLFRVKFSY
jgi:hypothetical protein